jgi:hypothetical protein
VLTSRHAATLCGLAMLFVRTLHTNDVIIFVGIYISPRFLTSFVQLLGVRHKLTCSASSYTAKQRFSYWY